MKLERLAQLYRSMAGQGLTKTKFEFCFRNLTFSVVYIAERFPHELLLGCRAHDLFLVIKVPHDFVVSTYLGADYKSLIDALGLRPDPNNKFSPNIFFEDLREKIPQAATPASTPTITEIALVSRDVEDPDKIYFLGWLSHDGLRSRPSSSNLAKTKRLCGHAAYDTCSRNNISSRWTDLVDLAQRYHEPGA